MEYKPIEKTLFRKDPCIHFSFQVIQDSTISKQESQGSLYTLIAAANADTFAVAIEKIHIADLPAFFLPQAFMDTISQTFIGSLKKISKS